MKKRKILIGLLVLSIMSFAACGKENGIDSSTTDSASLGTEVINNNLENPMGEDFYSYVNSVYLNTATLNKGEYIKNTFTETSNTVKQRVYNVLEELSKEDNRALLDKNSVEYKLITIYEQMKESKNKDYITENVRAILNKIESIQTFEKLQLLYNSEEFSIYNSIINIDVDNRGGIGKYNVYIEPVDLYGVRSALTDAQQNELKKNIEQEFIKLGYSEEKAKIIAEQAILINKNICNYYGGMDKKYSFINSNTLDMRVNNISINSMLEKLSYKSENNRVFVDETYLNLLRQLYIPENLEMIKSYHMVSVVHKLINIMPNDIFEIYDSTDDKIMNVEYVADEMKYAENMTKLMPDVLEKIYVDKYIDKNFQDKLVSLSEEIREIFINKIDDLQWMEEDTKEAAKKKIENIYVYPATIGESIDYSNLVINEEMNSESIIDNYVNVLKYNKQYRKSKMDENVDREKINIDALDSNLYYYPGANVVIICAGIINDEYQSETVKYEELLGKIGVCIAHEFGHSIDANGCDFDENGLLKSWWKSSDYNKFMKEVNDVKKYYDGMKIEDSITLNGELVKSEAMADLTAVSCCMDLLKKYDGADYKLFFESYAKQYREISTKEYRQYLSMVDTHLPSKVRVNNILNQFQQFYDTYKIEDGCKLYVSPENRINIF